jgi:hypothetical protein
LVSLIHEYRKTVWSINEDTEGFLTGKRYNVKENELGKKYVDYTGEVLKVKL